MAGGKLRGGWYGRKELSPAKKRFCQMYAHLWKQRGGVPVGLHDNRGPLKGLLTSAALLAGYGAESWCELRQKQAAYKAGNANLKNPLVRQELARLGVLFEEEEPVYYG
jgi:hypothetical protein